MNPADDPRALRTLFGRFASGVVVVTCGNGTEVHGMTANSFVSVSLSPPLLLVAVRRQARLHEKMLAHPRFGISVLADDQGDLSRHFAGQPVPGLIPRFTEQAGVPVLAGALAWMACARHDEWGTDTHTLFMGRLLDGGHAGEGRPLLFFGGGYHALPPAPPAFEGCEA
ncbi:flavin reductase family protein [Niveispirillum sp. KHB5.9]|uniref:flavin reductase family protein n=1 Tax=Niveispirillum sp. KHB5.9 TaxID=3400269 RepID=UPI003A872CD9